MSFIVKNTTFPNLLDLLAPHSCRGCGRIGEVLCNRCKNDIIIEHIDHPPNVKFPKSFPPVYIVSDRTALMNTLIHDFKYNSIRALARPLAEILHQVLPATSNSTALVPLPTISYHIRERGLDHTHLIAKHLAKLRHYKVQKILLRDQDTVQVGANRQTRLAQATTAYALNLKVKINPNTTYILLDDVWTTGASMKAAVKKLRQSGAKNIIIALLAVSRLNQD